MLAVINISTSSLREERSKTIDDLNIQMVLIEEENIKLFNKKERKNISKIAFQNRKDLEVVFQITIDYYKQIILKKDEPI